MYNLDRISIAIKDIEDYFKKLEIFKKGRAIIKEEEDPVSFHASTMMCLSIINRAIDLGTEILVKKEVSMPLRYKELFSPLVQEGQSIPLTITEGGKPTEIFIKAGKKFKVFESEGKKMLEVNSKSYPLEGDAAAKIDGVLKGDSVTVYEEKSESLLPKLFGAVKGTAFDALLTGVQWAAGAYMIGQMIGSMAGITLSKKITKVI